MICKTTLVNKAESRFSISIPVDANTTEQAVAQILQDVIFKMTFYRMSIALRSLPATAFQIIIGRSSLLEPTDLEGLNEDGIIIKKAQNSIIISSGSGTSIGGFNPMGLYYSMYVFIEEYLGCQAYTPTDYDIPIKTKICIPSLIYRKQNPSFDYRMTFYPNLLQGQASYTFSDWRRMNYFMEGWGLWVHSFDTLVPPSLFATNPEYFALINGQRNPASLDVTNPTVIEIARTKLTSLIAANPTAKFWSVSQNDTPTNQEFCQCENCKLINDAQESPMGALLTFVNNIASSFPTKTITTLAYGYSEVAPKTLRPRNNVMVMYCATGQNIISSLKAQGSDHFKTNLKKWGNLTDDLFVWDYIVNFDNLLLPIPNLKNLQSNLKYLKDNNVKNIFLQGPGDKEGELQELKGYIVAKLMWDVNTNVETATNNFLKYYYGKNNAPYIKKYIDLLHKKGVASDPVYSTGVPTPEYLNEKSVIAYDKVFANIEIVPEDLYYQRAEKVVNTITNLETINPAI